MMKKALRIALIGNYTLDAQESMQRFAAVLQKGLGERHQVVTLSPRAVFGSLLPQRSPARKWLAYLDKYVLFSLRLRLLRSRFDVVHVCDQGNAPLAWALGSKCGVITCHDVLAIKSAMGLLPEQATGRAGRIYQAIIHRSLPRARHVACVSDETARELVALGRVGSDRVRIVWNGLNYPYSPMSPADRLKVQGELGLRPDASYFLHVGGNHWYKNRIGVLRLYSELRKRLGSGSPMLVLAGKEWTVEMHEEIESLGLQGCVVPALNVSNEQLRALYSGALAFLFPSLYEGFGWPIVEAQACGCPVFASNREPMISVGGSSAIYFDPLDLAQAAGIVIDNLGRRDALIAGGRVNVERFSEDQMIAGYERLYREAISSIPRPPLLTEAGGEIGK